MAFQLVQGNSEALFQAGMGQTLPPLTNFSTNSSSAPSPPASQEVTSPPAAPTTPPANEQFYYGAQVQSPNALSFEKGKSSFKSARK